MSANITELMRSGIGRLVQETLNRYDMELKEGTYTLPPELKAVVKNGDKVIVMPRKRREVAESMHCRDCAWQRLGKKCTQNQWRESPYCVARPKHINGQSGYFYCAPDGRVACYLFKSKEGEEQ